MANSDDNNSSLISRLAEPEADSAEEIRRRRLLSLAQIDAEDMGGMFGSIELYDLEGNLLGIGLGPFAATALDEARSDD